VQASGNVVSSEQIYNIFLFEREDVAGRRAAAQSASQWERSDL